MPKHTRSTCDWTKVCDAGNNPDTVSQAGSDSANVEPSVSLRDEALAQIDLAQVICSEFPGQCAGMGDEIEQVRQMIHGSDFYSIVTSEERRAVLAAMATEFSGTGHW